MEREFLHPQNENGQLYTIHAIGNGKIDVQLLFAITTKKSEII